MSAQIKFTPDPDPDWIIDPGDFPNTAESARALGLLAHQAFGVRMATRKMGVIIRPLAFSASAATLVVYFRRGMDARQIALRTGLEEQLVEAFNEGLKTEKETPDRSTS